MRKSYGIWNYGDYEILHSNAVNSRRQEYGSDYPCCGVLFDFGKELFGFLNVYCSDGAHKLHVSYGEYRNEAVDIAHSIFLRTSAT